MLPHEWAVLTGVTPRPNRKPARNNTCVVFRRVSEGTGRPNTGNALLTPLVLRVSMGGGTCLSSGDQIVRLHPIP